MSSEEDDRAYLASVMTEIEAEVVRRRASGDLPARLERELDELFLEHSPMAGRGGALVEALRLVDGAAYIDPAVPIASDKSGGALVKKGLRTLNFWYIGWVTSQMSRFATATGRALHLVDDALGDLRRQLDAQWTAPAPLLEVGPGWWVDPALKAVAGAPGRVLHAVSGDGWLVRDLVSEGVDAYGIDPRPGRVDRAELEGTDLREEWLAEHLGAVEPSALGGAVLTGVVDGMAHGQRHQLLELLSDRLAPGGVLAVHSLTPSAWTAEEAPAECDLAPGHPLRASTWPRVLEPLGFEVAATAGPDGRDYLVVATRR